MIRSLTLAALALLVAAAPVTAAGVSGLYLESRTCDVWTGPCFANADMSLGGKHAVLAWKVEKGTVGGVKLDGLGVVAVVEASDTLGLEQTGPSKAVLLVDEKADKAQREALVQFAKRQGGKLVGNVVRVEAAPVRLEVCECKEGGCTKLSAGAARVETRCLDAKHDKACGNESAFYPPLAKDVKVTPAMAVESAFSGKGLHATWKETDRRGAYVGKFETK